MAMQISQGRRALPNSVRQTTRAPELELDVSAETSPDGTTESPTTTRGGYEGGTWLSHAAFGLGVLALWAPLLIPGIHLLGLLISYFALASVAMIVFMAWGVIREVREAWRARNWRR